MLKPTFHQLQPRLKKQQERKKKKKHWNYKTSALHTTHIYHSFAGDCMAVSKVKPQILNYDFSFMTSQEEYAEKQTRWVERGGRRLANSSLYWRWKKAANFRPNWVPK